MTVLEAFCAFLLGGAVYVLLEFLWRGHSHFSMFFAGGLCFLLLYGTFSGVGADWSLLFKCLYGSVVITAVEFLTGALVNIRLKLNVWDYSALPYNAYGQICLRYSLLWGLLTLPIAGASALLARLFS
ncbi:MAG: hypothetical protein IJC67_06555 [Clostridia bacterium]|nr:hypothetical protein [Clostridia bacterium]